MGSLRENVGESGSLKKCGGGFAVIMWAGKKVLKIEEEGLCYRRRQRGRRVAGSETHVHGSSSCHTTTIHYSN